MKMLTVKQVAKASGVSVRALHHYDEIGLLKPAQIGKNRYRYYGREELLRLQQILLHRELDIPLSDISAILDDPKFDRLKALRQQREKLDAEAKRFAELVRTIDRTIASLKGDRAMKNADLYKGVSPEKQAEYEKWLSEKYGDGMNSHIKASKKALATMSADERSALSAELAGVEEALAESLRKGVAPQANSLNGLLARHREWVSTMWGRDCPPEAYAGLADTYLAHPDFVARFERIETGFAEYISSAMKAHAKRVGD